MLDTNVCSRMKTRLLTSSAALAYGDVYESGWEVSFSFAAIQIKYPCDAKYDFRSIKLVSKQVGCVILWNNAESPWKIALKIQLNLQNDKINPMAQI